MAPLLKQGGILAHYTSTLPGVASLPHKRKAVTRICRFKKRAGPFLLLVDSKQTARKYIRWYPKGLRQLIRRAWPGDTTLAVAGQPGLPALCYRKGMLALRVDADAACLRLAKACGGVLLSSSLNRRGEPVRRPCYAVQMRWHCHLDGRAGLGASGGRASKMIRVDHRRFEKLR